MSRILIVDCFDSFTYNIYHYLEELNGGDISVVRYNDFDPNEVRPYSHIVLSPGPGLPKDYPKISLMLEKLLPTQAVLGVCLGHQAIAEYYGAKLIRLCQVKHGLPSSITFTSASGLFKGLNDTLTVGHYHSWVVSDEEFPADVLTITSYSEDGLIMSYEHSRNPIFGVQFHPESVLTDNGKTFFKNWLAST